MFNLDCIEYYYDNGARKRAALIDYKDGALKVWKFDDAFYAQIELANDLKLPFFHVLTYLDPERFAIPMYFVVPRNTDAKNRFKFLNFDVNGKWMSIREYSKFQHWLRKLKPELNTLNKLSDLRDQYQLPGEHKEIHENKIKTRHSEF